MFGVLSTSGLFDKGRQLWTYKALVDSGEADSEDDTATALEKVLERTHRLCRDRDRILGINVMVSAELMQYLRVLINRAIGVRQEEPDMRDHFKVLFTSAGDPVGWSDKIKDARFIWIHVLLSVRAALRCKKAGMDVEWLLVTKAVFTSPGNPCAQAFCWRLS